MYKFPMNHTSIRRELKKLNILNKDEYKLLPHSKKHKLPRTVKFSNSESNKSLTYIGCNHLRKWDKQHDLINEIISTETFDLVIVETDASLNTHLEKVKETVNKHYDLGGLSRLVETAGESRLAIYLSLQKNIPFIAIESTIKEKTDYLLFAGYEKADIFATMVGVRLSFYSRIKDKPKLDDYLSQYINIYKKQTNWENFDYSTELVFKQLSKLWGSEIEINNPLFFKDKFLNENSKYLTNKIQKDLIESRDLHLIKQIQRLANQYNNILCIYGNYHLAVQEAAIKELYNLTSS